MHRNKRQNHHGGSGASVQNIFVIRCEMLTIESD